MFETNLRDERYLPFEGAGVISTWRLEMPSEIRQFDYNTISDVILHIRYTARDGGADSLKRAVADATAAGMVRLFSVRHEFPSEWAKFKNVKLSGDIKTAELSLRFREEHYPYWTKGLLHGVRQVEVLATEKTCQPTLWRVHEGAAYRSGDRTVSPPKSWLCGPKRGNGPINT